MTHVDSPKGVVSRAYRVFHKMLPQMQWNGAGVLPGHEANAHPTTVLLGVWKIWWSHSGALILPVFTSKLKHQQLLFSNSESLDLVRPSKIVVFPCQEALEATTDSGESPNICLFQCFLIIFHISVPQIIFLGFYFSSEMEHCNCFP